MTNTEITSTSTLTDVLNVLKEQGIERLPFYNSVNHELARHEAGRWGAQGYIFMTADGMKEWDDTRYLTIHYGAVTYAAPDTEAYKAIQGGIAVTIIEALGQAGFQALTGWGVTSSTIHVPKSRF